MDLSKMTLFNMVSTRMSYLGERQKVLAQNVANADTPKYRPSDLKEMNFQAVLRGGSGQQKVRMAATQPLHLASLRQDEQFTAQKQGWNKTYETSPNGNAVVLEEQMLKVSEVQQNYMLATNLYQKNLGMLRSAIGRGQ
jgi:flagellar basal-body rod protein FlgB